MISGKSAWAIKRSTNALTETLSVTLTVTLGRRYARPVLLASLHQYANESPRV